MIIEHALIRGFGPLRAFKADFKHENCLIGTNGCGKTFLLAALAGVCGTDEATQLIAGCEIDTVSIRVRDGEKRFVFNAKGLFDAEQIAEFKSQLPHRVNFPLTEWSNTFMSQCCDSATALKNFREFYSRVRGTGCHDTMDHMFRYSPRNRTVGFYSGDGFNHAMSLFLGDSASQVPLLLDTPGRHMDLNAKRVMSQMLCRQDRQLFYTTHCPEMILHGAWENMSSNQKIIDVGQDYRKKS